ncbi:MAG TPA: hypothetical protein VGR14_05950 [Verrucomicrobiae bacterium]|jgi:hypothetical protein|nr:hypothetical protein [Verrucomicrobiae bacterium]
MEAKDGIGSLRPKLIVRVHLTDGSIESFGSTDETEVARIWEKIDPSRLFSQPRLIFAGEYSKSVFVSSQILRLDFIQKTYECWGFPGGYSDIVELSEADFKKHVHLEQPALMAKRKQPTPVGDLLVSFLKLRIAGGSQIFLMVEVPVKLPAESQSFMQFLLSKGSFHMRLREGGVGVVNLAHLAGYTAYPGVAQTPTDAWASEPVPSEPPGT